VKLEHRPVMPTGLGPCGLRPEIAGYSQLSLAISSAVHRALAQQVPAARTLGGLSGELNQIAGNG
jgi:hypothetical protein